MPPVASTWSFDPRSVPRNDYLYEQLRLRPLEATPFLLAKLAEGPWFNFLPVLRSSAPALVGVRLIPGRPVVDCPLVVASYRNSTTLATTCADGLAMALGDMGIGCTPHAWGSLEREWGRLAPAIEELDAAMGGGQAVGRLRTLLDDSAFRGRLTENLFGDDAAPLWHRLHSALDPTDSHLAMLDAARAGVEGRAPVEAEGELGPWAPAAASLAFNAAHAYAHRTPRVDLAWRASLRTTAADIHQGTRPDEPNDGNRARGGRAAARHAVKYGGQATHGAHPLWPAVAALAADRGYDGAQHLSAAVALEEQGAAELAWGAIECSALYAVSLGKTSALPAFDAARALAVRQGWDVLTEHLDRIAAARRVFGVVAAEVPGAAPGVREAGGSAGVEPAPAGHPRESFLSGLKASAEGLYREEASVAVDPAALREIEEVWAGQRDVLKDIEGVRTADEPESPIKVEGDPPT